MGGIRSKALIPVPEHEPLLYYTLHGLKKAGIDDLVVVTGWQTAEVQDYVVHHRGPEGVMFIRNARYASWGNFHSVRVAVDQSPGFDLMIVNCDIVVHPEVLTRVARTPGDLVLAVEQRYRLDDEDMRVRVDERRVRAIGKDLPMRLSHGEFCGVSLLREEGQRLYREIATGIEWQRHSSLYYEDVYAAMLERVDARAAEVLPGEYAEVDLPEDMPGAAAVIDRHAEAWPSPATGAERDAPLHSA
jgi:L-glutamine-phosphate cytidylyltransferase